LVNAPSGASIAAITGDFTWTPTDLGSFTFTVRVSNGTMNQDQAVTVTVEFPLPSAVIDSDSDGLSDLLEYAFATNPSASNSNPFRFVGTNGNTVTLAFPWNWQAAGITWQIRHGQDLSNVANWPVVETDSITHVREGNIDSITIFLPKIHPDRSFYVLQVIAN
jgi:Putative Ig domain